MIDLSCPRCGRPLPVEVVNSGRTHECRNCRQEGLLDVFPAAAGARSEPDGSPATIAGDGSATCFFHDERAARAVCDGCGRYLCPLCDIPVGRQHLCPECLEARNRGGRRQTLPNERIAWDRAALALAVFPLVPVFMVFSVITAPAALFLVLRHWRRPGMLARNGRVRFAVAGILALLQVGFWVMFIIGVST